MHLLLLLFLSYVSLNVHSKQFFFVGLEQHEGEWFSFLNVTLDNFYSCVKYITYLQYCVKKKKNWTTVWLPQTKFRGVLANVNFRPIKSVCVLPPAPLSSVALALHHQTHYKVESSKFSSQQNYELFEDNAQKIDKKQIIIRDLMLWEMKIKIC